MKSVLYIVGGFCDVGFVPYGNFYNPTKDIKAAKGLLKKAVTENIGYYDFKIYTISVDSDNVIGDDGLGEFKVLKDNTKKLLQNYEWVDSLIDSAYLYFENNLTYSERTKIATIKIKAMLCNGYISPKDKDAWRDRWKTELLERVKVAYIPEIKKILDDNNLDIKVEFKLNGRKLIKGYITKTTK